MLGDGVGEQELSALTLDADHLEHGSICTERRSTGSGTVGSSRPGGAHARRQDRRDRHRHQATAHDATGTLVNGANPRTVTVTDVAAAGADTTVYTA